MKMCRIIDLDKKYHSKIGKLHKLIPRPSEKENFWRSFYMGMSIEEMKNVDVRTVDPATLVDVTQIVIDESLPQEERVKEYLRQVKNPYCFKVGDVVVKCSYSNDGVTLKERFEQLVRTL